MARWRVSLLVGVVAEACVLCPLRVPPRPRPLDQFKIPTLPQVDSESIPKFCNLSHWLPVGDACREGISRVLCSVDTLVEAYTEGCPGPESPQKCSQCERSKRDNFWVVNWFDSLGKMPSGVSDGNYYWLGDYEICKNLREENKFRGQYCWVRMEVPDALVEAGCPQTDPLGIIYGVCAPLECTAAELQKIAAAYLPYGVGVDCEVDANVGIVEHIIIGIFGMWKVFLLTATIMYGRKKGPSWFKKFDLHHNANLILSTKRAHDKSLHVVSGLECITFFMLVAGNVYNIMLPYIENVAFAFDEVSSVFAQITNNYSYHVDGLIALVCYFTASLLYGNLHSLKDVGITFAKAFIRFWPCYAIFVLYMSMIFEHAASGPMWIHGDINDRCASHWWKNLLFINNFFDVRSTCVDFGYAISLLAQFLVVVTLLCYVATKHVRVSIYIAWAGIVASIAYTFTIIFVNKLPPAPVLTAEPVTAKDMEALLSLVVVNPLARLAPALIGFLFALMPKDDEHRFNAVFRGIMTLVGVAMGLLSAFYLIGYTSGGHDHTVLLSLYGALHRPAWATSLMLLAFLCTDGKRWATVESFLGWRIFSPLSKHVVMGVAISEPLILHFFSALHRPAHATHWSTIYSVVSAAAVALKLALLMVVLYGRPVRNLFEWSLFTEVSTEEEEGKERNGDLEMEETTGHLP